MNVIKSLKTSAVLALLTTGLTAAWFFLAFPTPSSATDAEAGEASSRTGPYEDALFHDPTSPVAGNPEGDVTIVEFFDYNCPYCRKVAPMIAEFSRNDPKLRIIYKEFPVLGPDSMYAAQAALAARLQNRYHEFHRALMQASGSLAEEQILQIAREVGLDTTKLKANMRDPAIAEAIERNLALARELGLFATPSLVIDGQVLQGAVKRDKLEELIDQVRQGQD